MAIVRRTSSSTAPAMYPCSSLTASVSAAMVEVAPTRSPPPLPPALALVEEAAVHGPRRLLPSPSGAHSVGPGPCSKQMPPTCHLLLPPPCHHPLRPPFLQQHSCSNPVASSSSQSESFGESNPGPATMKQKKKKSSAGTALRGDEAPPVRKCMHCEIQKTPQWRAGPMGPKTLCNACGVRYKSGRLFPEYRPAASPTFVPVLHSNSHKKVVEMRIKASQRAAAAGLPSPESASKDSCDLLAYIRRRE